MTIIDNLFVYHLYYVLNIFKIILNYPKFKRNFIRYKFKKKLINK